MTAGMMWKLQLLTYCKLHSFSQIATSQPACLPSLPGVVYATSSTNAIGISLHIQHVVFKAYCSMSPVNCRQSPKQGLVLRDLTDDWVHGPKAGMLAYQAQEPDESDELGLLLAGCVHTWGDGQSRC